jgi:hypothetical protein
VIAGTLVSLPPFDLLRGTVDRRAVRTAPRVIRAEP